MIRATLLTAAGIRFASASELVHDPHKDVRYSGVPAFPADMAYVTQRDGDKKKHKSIVGQIMEHNPFVVLGCGLTVAALVGMFVKMYKGDKMGAQRMMQYRIMAQFGTILALVAGITLFAAYTPSKTNGEKE